MNINKIIKTLIASSFFLNAGWGLLGPVFAIFIIQNIEGGGAEIVGFAAMTYWIVKSFLQIPIGKYLDKNRGEKDDFYFVVIGTILAGFTPLGYLFASLSWHIYALQVLHAIGMAMMVPSWGAVFTRHVDKGHEAFEWGLNSTSLGFGAGIAGALGGLFVVFFGFKIIFLLVALFTFFSAFLHILIYKDIIPRDKIFPQTPHLEHHL